MVRLYVKCIHPLVLDELRAEVASLPVRKQCKWKGSMRNPQGVSHMLRFHKGYFQIKMEASHAAEFGDPKDGWAPIIELRGTATFEQIAEAYGVAEAQNFFGGDALSCYMGRMPVSDEAARSAQGLLAAVAETTQLVAENHTGQHHRNRTVSINTKSGEPVRG